MKFKKMLIAFERGEYNEAADEALDSRWAVQVGSRAQRDAKMIREG
jgi:lysozyme